MKSRVQMIGNFNVEDVVKKRTAPGILILDYKGEFLYINKRAKELIHDMNHDEVQSALNKMLLSTSERSSVETDEDSGVFVTGKSGVYSLRSFTLVDSEDYSSALFAVLIEQVSFETRVDLSRISRVYHLSQRECEIVNVLLKGLSNKGIAEKLFISEYTVKDHVKNIMSKLGVSNRMGIVSRLFEFS